MADPAVTAQVNTSSSASASRRRIALVIHALHGGGAERLMSQLANRWSQAKHDVHLITLDSVKQPGLNAHTSSAEPGPQEYEVDAQVTRHGLDLLRPSRGIVDGLRANWVRVKRLRLKLTELAPDCVISFCDRMNITTVTAALSLGKPLWIAEHSDPSRQHLGLLWETWRQWAYRRLARAQKTGCVVLSQAIAQTMSQRFPGLQIKVIPPAIRLHDCANTLTQQPPMAASAGTKYQLLSIGRHSPEKNLTALLHAWQQLRTRFPEWRLVLAGDGPQHAELLALAQQLQSQSQIEPSVQFAGWVSDPWSLYGQSSLLAITSLYEGVPVAMLEAMAAGVPCVSTPCASTVEEFSRVGAVQLADSTSSQDIAAALSVVMGNAELRARLSQRGREVAGRFSWESVGPMWDELLDKLA